MFKINNKHTRATSLTSFWCFYCLIVIVNKTRENLCKNIKQSNKILKNVEMQLALIEDVQ